MKGVIFHRRQSGMAKKGLILAIILLGITVSCLFYANYIQWEVKKGGFREGIDALFPVQDEEMIMESKKRAIKMTEIVLSNAYGEEYTSFLVDGMTDSKGTIWRWHIRVDPEVYPGVTHEVIVDFSFYYIEFEWPDWYDHDCSFS